MAEIVERCSALDGVYRTGGIGRQAGVTMAERRGLAITQVAAFPDTAMTVAGAIEEAFVLAPPMEPCLSTLGLDRSICWVGPQRWWLIGPAVTLDLGADGAVTDLSHGRAAIRLSGPALRDLLAKGCSLDFHPRAFRAGDCPQSAVAHIQCLIHCLDDGPTVDLYPARSYAVSLWQWLTDAAGEFGYEVLPAVA
ncbi:MAG: sarcosine oxidase subunit gamma family protein [Alphaproteobacteria bacterium]|nr:sarcosine oxidase subunit gamma family protein [Alphaproteobacteria bacterium]MDP6566647.1 sarcosine oxidase subunit gamma family protein [Alphaproteobacteria bacterium]MDP6812011.1 sarcosine oxidase subunit gamma family protein [Alphaproteobacteria bacterium]